MFSVNNPYDIEVALYFAGLDEIGIYRVSGVTSDIQQCKKLFDKSKFTHHIVFGCCSAWLILSVTDKND